MAKLARFFFLIADLMAIIMIIGGGVGFVRLLFSAITVTFGPLSVGAQAVFATWILFVVGSVLVAAACFACILLIRRQIIGLAILAGLGVLGVFITPFELGVYIFILACQILILGLPWVLMYYDLKKRGVPVS